MAQEPGSLYLAAVWGPFPRLGERIASLPVQNFLMWHSDGFHGRVMRYSWPHLIFKLVSSPKETTMKEWLKPEITEF